MQVKHETLPYKRNLCQNMKFAASTLTEITAARLLPGY
jgi:hypothetical protein